MNAALTRDLPPILGRLIPRLSSPFDGERLAVVAAIDRALRSSGMDWNDLAASLTAPVSASAPRQPRRTESPESAEIRAWLEAVSREDWINTWTAGFIDNILARPTLDRLSKKQIAVINNIVEEAYRRGVRVDRRAA